MSPFPWLVWSCRDALSSNLFSQMQSPTEHRDHVTDSRGISSNICTVSLIWAIPAVVIFVRAPHPSDLATIAYQIYVNDLRIFTDHRELARRVTFDAA